MIMNVMPASDFTIGALQRIRSLIIRSNAVSAGKIGQPKEQLRHGFGIKGMDAYDCSAAQEEAVEAAVTGWRIGKRRDIPL
jgi:hypothetical protein